MAIWKVDIEKMLGNEYWSNRYFVSGDTLADAHNTAEDIVQVERTFHGNAVTFTKFVTSSVAQNDDVYLSTTVNIPGLLNLTAYLPLFNVVRVVFNKIGGGRPYFKQYRGCLDENQVNGSVITAGTAFYNAITTVLPGLVSVMVDTSGFSFASAALDTNIRMRQLRRGRTRRSTPILPA